MLERLRKRVTYANVTSTLALFLALTTGTAYAANEWTGANIRDGSITSADIKNGTVSGTDIKNATVTSSDIADAAVGGSEIADGTVATADIKDGTVGTADIADGSVTTGDVTDESLTGADIDNGSLNGDQEIADNTITTFDLADDSVDADEVLDFGLTNEDIGVLFVQVAADGTLTASSGGVTPSRLGSGQYSVDFGRNITACAFVATQGEGGTGGAPGAILGVTDRASNVEAVFVSVRDADGAFIDRAFQLVVVC